MAYAHFERLSAVDAAFLAVEDVNAHMHMGSLGLFDAAPLTRDDGGLDFERILAFAEAQLHKSPRLRQKLAWVPGFEHPVWIDDRSFNLAYHMRHTALPTPGDERRLKRLAGRIMSQQLDRGKPLWELWFVEGVEGGRFAVISKLHHSLADGIGSSEALNFMMGPDPDYRARPAARWVPRPAPGGARLFLDELRHSATEPFRIGREAKGEGTKPGGEPGAGAIWKGTRDRGDALRGLRRVLERELRGQAPTPLNVDIGPHRRIDWTDLDLGELREIKNCAGGKLNDVVLAIVSGALRRFLRQRGVAVEGLAFRAALPVSVRARSERGNLGNRVSGLLAALPLDEPDPWRRLLRVVDLTHELKGSGGAAGVELVTRLAELVPMRLLAPLLHWAAEHVPANLVVTNVPGPEVPVYLVGAPMIASYPIVPLAPRQGLGVALFSYHGRLYWGFNSDWDALPDLHDLVGEVHVEFEALRKAATEIRGQAAGVSAEATETSPSAAV